MVCFCWAGFLKRKERGFVQTPGEHQAPPDRLACPCRLMLSTCRKGGCSDPSPKPCPRPAPPPRHSPLSWHFSGERSCLCHSRGVHCSSWGCKTACQDKTPLTPPCPAYQKHPRCAGEAPPSPARGTPASPPYLHKPETHSGAEPVSSSVQGAAHAKEEGGVSRAGPMLPIEHVGIRHTPVTGTLK